MVITIVISQMWVFFLFLDTLKITIMLTTFIIVIVILKWLNYNTPTFLTSSLIFLKRVFDVIVFFASAGELFSSVDGVFGNVFTVIEWLEILVVVEHVTFVPELFNNVWCYDIRGIFTDSTNWLLKLKSIIKFGFFTITVFTFRFFRYSTEAFVFLGRWFLILIANFLLCISYRPLFI